MIGINTTCLFKLTIYALNMKPFCSIKSKIPWTQIWIKSIWIMILQLHLYIWDGD